MSRRLREHLAPAFTTRAAELRSIGHRARQVAVLAVVTGAATGLAVAGFDRLVAGVLFDHLVDAPPWAQVAGPVAGLAAAALSLRFLARGASGSTADEYIKGFHDEEHRLDLAPVPGRLVASAATLGGGAAMGFEGPSIYIGAAIGSYLQRRFSRFFARTDSKVLLVCGAAAGVAAIFKAPATGLVFALEVPYRQDLARRMLLPAMFASAASYVSFVAINGTTPLFPISGAPPFDIRDLGGAAVLGLLCGAGARAFAAALRAAKRAAARTPAHIRVAIAGSVLVAVYFACRAITSEPLTLGSGYATINWALRPGHAVATIAAVFLLRAAATAAAVGGGGVGGLFVPLVVQGAVIGSAAAAAFGAHDTSLFPLLGVAAFLGAGYRVPLAAVVFVAESTGRPGFVVPGLIAAATSQLLMGRSSVTPYQADARTGLLQRRLALPVSAALRTDALTVPPDATLQELYDHHVGGMRMRTVPVVDGAAFVGMIVLHDLLQVPHERWASTAVSEVLHGDWPTCDVTSRLSTAVATMEQHDVDRLPILDGDAYVGVVTTGEILKLDAILETTETEAPSRRP